MFRSVSRLSQIGTDKGVIRTLKSLETVLHYGLTFGFIFLEEDAEGAKKWNIPVSRRLRAWRHGFTGKSWTILDLDERNPELYVNDVDKIVWLPRANKPYQDIVANKASFYTWFHQLTDQLPTVHGHIIRGTYIGTTDTNAGLIDLLERENRLVLKPLHGHRGQGVHFLRKEDEEYLLQGLHTHHRFTDEERLLGKLADFHSYLVSEHVDQHQYAARIYPETTNTIRVLTIVDPKTNTPFIPRAMHRFGSDESQPLDSWSQGGVGAPVDVETGTLTDAYIQLGSDGLRKRTTHPDTNAQITDVEIPHWDEITECVLQFASAIPGAPFLSWDVLLSRDGPVVIEANSPGDKDVVQLRGGLFEDERCRRALTEYLPQ